MQEAKRDNFYYSLILLFVPFRDESTLVIKGETMKKLLGVTDKHLYVALKIISTN
uniref:Uncharacterized protein n=1 Tax=Amphimedon queenslandica TaxID=400682 RepID=A0A1X7VBR4_AMPQE